MKEWSRLHSCLELSVLTTAPSCRPGTILQRFRNPTCSRSLSIFCKSRINIPDVGHNPKQTWLLCQFITCMNAAVMRLRALTWAHGSVIVKAQEQNWHLEKSVCVPFILILCLSYPPDGHFHCCKLKFICALRETDILPSIHAHTSSDYASVFSVLDEISSDLCAQHKPLERPSHGSHTVLVIRRRWRRGGKPCSKLSPATRRVAMETRLKSAGWWGPGSLQRHTHTHTLTHWHTCYTLYICRRRSAAALRQ